MVKSRSRRVFVSLLALLLCAFLALPLSLFVGRGAAQAAPVLSVTKSVGNVLLGGEATVSITATNTSASDRGFNLSITDTFGSDPWNPDPPVGDGRSKTVTFVSASGSDGPLTPSSLYTDPLTNELTVRFDDIRDLEPGESTTINIVVRPDDPLWAVNDKIVDHATAEVNTVANGSGATITGTDDGESTVIPIKMIAKSANQSTADTQATGCGGLIAGRWPYTYTLEVQNNYVNQTDGVVVTDDVPDGVEFMGMVSGPAPDVDVLDDATGIRHLEWEVGDMAPGATWTATYKAGIRYDYYGTDNGGTNRPCNDYSGAPGSLGVPVPDKTGFSNTAELTAEYQSQPVSDDDSASVTGTYVAVQKSVNAGTVSNGGTVTFTIRLRASEYYDILRDGVLRLVDTLPDGFTYQPATASPQPSDWSYDAGTGVTTIEWDQTVLTGVPAGDTVDITFDAVVEDAWVIPPDPAHPYIVAGDVLTNDICFQGSWHDEVDAGRPDSLTDCNSSASTVVVGPRPSISKQISLNGTDYYDSVEATVGDTLYFRVRFNTADGSNPLVSGVNFSNVDVVDWYPLGTSLVANSEVITYSASGHFSYGHAVKFGAHFGDPPEAVASGELTGGAWSLGDVAKNGWWQAVFQVVVDDDAAHIADGKVNHDFAKLSWDSSLGSQFSGRDLADLVCAEPELTVAKSVLTPPAHPGAGQDWVYRITLENVGTAAARNVLVADVLPPGMRGYDPTGGTVTVTQGSTVLAEGTDYVLSYDAFTGELLVDFDDGGAVRTGIPAPPDPASKVTIDYTARVDSTVGAGASLRNDVEVTWSAQDAGTTPNRDYGPATASATIHLPGITIEKSIVGTDTVPLGTGTASQVTYRLTVTVPPHNLATGNNVNRLQDVVQQDGLEYVAGSTAMSDVSGNPTTPARFRDGSTSMEPAINWTSPNPGSTLTWDLADSISNLGKDDPYVFQVDFKLLATGLITPVGQGGERHRPLQLEVLAQHRRRPHRRQLRRRPRQYPLE